MGHLGGFRLANTNTKHNGYGLMGGNFAVFLILHPYPRHFANQISNHADLIGVRQALQRISPADVSKA